MIERLLAKWAQDPAHPEPMRTLPGHTRAAVEAGQAIVDASAERILNALGLDGDQWPVLFARAVPLTALLHDLGKANDHFQKMVRRDLDGVQGHRHEFLSLWLTGREGPLNGWAFDGTDALTETAVLCAVAGHHLKFEKYERLRFDVACRLPRLRVLAGHVDFARALAVGSEKLGLGDPPPQLDTVFGAGGEQLDDACLPDLKALDKVLQANGPEYRRFVAAVSATFVSADVVSSAAARRPVDVAAWVRLALATTLETEEIRAVAMRRLGPAQLRPFQETVATAGGSVALVRAGCGSGKTVAAYLWAARNAAGRKLFVCYPTTGTATEGFADYLVDGAISAGLFHSRAAVDLEYLDNGDGPASDAASHWAEAATAFRLWTKGLTVATADTVLGLLHDHRTPLAAFPAVAGATFVFDEIHQYDDRMFSTLCRLIESFRRAPVLVMTASLQAHRLLLLRNAAACRGEELSIIDGPADLETGHRYELLCGDGDSALGRVRDVLEERGKVLWVCNTVESARQQATTLRAAGLSPLVYHSRFRYDDRARRHRDAVDAFSRPGAALAVTTQVCEVSLDLSADLLISHVAPMSALIQRMGRLNRRFDPSRPAVQPAILIEPTSARPYDATELDAARRWISRLCGAPRSQRDLSEAFAEGSPSSAGQAAMISCSWLDAAPYAYPTPLRNVEPSLAVLLPDDATHCRDSGGRVDVREVVRRSIPMPLGSVLPEFERWRRLAMAFVAPTGRVEYDPELGARWMRRDSHGV